MKRNTPEHNMAPARFQEGSRRVPYWYILHKISAGLISLNMDLLLVYRHIKAIKDILNICLGYIGK